MNNLIDLLQTTLGSSTQQAIAEKAGTDTQTVANTLQQFMPLVTKALANNASSANGANALFSALSKDHDGGVLDNVLSAFGGNQSDMGSKILGHVFGGKMDAITQYLGKTSGTDSHTASTILQYAMPLVMGAIGRQTKSQGLSVESLAGFLSGSAQTAEVSNPNAMGIVGKLLDQDGDGSIADDIMNTGLKAFTNWMR